MSGVIGRDGDTDFYQLHVAAGQKLTIDLFARRLGTRLDLFMRVMDAAGKELAKNDDAAGKDSRLVWSPPSAGDYTVQVMDIAGQGGDDYGYRLEMTTAPAPDFKLMATPDVVNIPRGSAQVLRSGPSGNEFTGDSPCASKGCRQRDRQPVDAREGPGRGADHAHRSPGRVRRRLPPPGHWNGNGRRQAGGAGGAADGVGSAPGAG